MNVNMNYEVLTANKMSMLVFSREDGGSSLRNVGIYLQSHTALQTRRPTTSMKAKDSSENASYSIDELMTERSAGSH
jgi:hypothetical protein